MLHFFPLRATDTEEQDQTPKEHKPRKFWDRFQARSQPFDTLPSTPVVFL